MAKLSAGVLRYRWSNKRLEVLLVHPGGPFWSKKDLGAWSLPKGEYTEGEDPLSAAKREFTEETGIPADGDYLALGELKQASGKRISAWAAEGDCSVDSISSNTFSLEWPPRSGNFKDFPEVDSAKWFSVEEAKSKIVPGQAGFIDVLSDSVGYVPLPDEHPADISGIEKKQGSLFE